MGSNCTARCVVVFESTLRWKIVSGMSQKFIFAREISFNLQVQYVTFCILHSVLIYIIVP